MKQKRSPDVSDRNVSQPKSEDTVSHLNIYRIAYINKHNQVYLFFTPLKDMTPEERDYRSKAWVNDGRYKGGEG